MGQLDKDSKFIVRLSIGVFITIGLVVLAVIGVALWAIISLVQHFVG